MRPTIKFSEGVVFVRPEDAPQPVSVWGLITSLGVEDDPEQAQADAVRRWLESNEPNINLQRSIERSGLLETVG